ncbi:paired domain-containing protein [Trichonephila clavipes]|nr:paired domain-containing protein [Trichonephila clavipes]
MATKSVEISLDMRNNITELHKEGKSFREIGKILKLSFTTFGYIVKKYLETGSVENNPRPGGSSKLTSRAKRMLVRDEAHFWLNGYVNKQNCRIWSEASPQVYVETPLHPEKLTVWCALWAGGILLQKR